MATSPSDFREPEAPPPRAPILELTDVTLTAGSLPGARTLVKGLSFSLARGDHLVIVGGNGCGKSTLLSALAGLTRPASGSIVRPPSPPGVLFQDGGLWPHLSVAQHLAFVDTHDDPAWCRRLLETYGLASLADARPETLSGGERLRLGLARALANRPSWLLLDEPLAHLDPEVCAVVRETLPLLVDELDAATIVVTHAADDVLHFGDQLLALSGHGGWWLGAARFALNSPPTADLAIFAERGTLFSAVADASGAADFGLGLSLEGCPPGQTVRAHLDAAAVRLACEGEGILATFVAPDRHEGSWVRVNGRLLRCADPAGPLRPGDPARLRIEGRLRRLLEPDQGLDTHHPPRAAAPDGPTP